jgi:hypothetical protein
MLCYCCVEQGIQQPAVALCRSCSAGLCLEHLRETASRFGSSHVLDTCHHDTWAVPKHPQGATEHRGGA